MVSLSAVMTALMIAVPRLSSAFRVSGKDKSELYDLLYGMNWGETTTNNYGFAPAQGEGPERYQLQMYAELEKLRRSCAAAGQIERVLEVSCGRGGGLSRLVEGWSEGVHAVGLDWSQNALQFCQHHYADNNNTQFVRGTALQLPFAAGAFDVVINIEASNSYGDDTGFFREVYRVLRPGGLFLYADLRRPRDLGLLEERLHDAGFRGSLRDITPNVLLACEEDSERRRNMIRTRVPWYYRMLVGSRLAHYAAIKGSKKFARFQDGRRIYFTTCQQKAA